MNLAGTGGDEFSLLLIDMLAWDLALDENVAATVPAEQVWTALADFVKMKDPYSAFTESVNDCGLSAINALGSQVTSLERSMNPRLSFSPA